MKIELKGLKKRFGQHIIFDQFNISIESGEMVCILGKSGSGKTTLLNILGLIEKKDAGQILYNGKLIHTRAQQRKLLSKKISFIFQNFGLIDNETVYDNLNLIKQLKYKNKKAKIELMVGALTKVGLDEGILNKKVFECSGGEQQRIAIVKILLKDCDVIFADEPTASLDNENKVNILKHLKELHKLGKTIVIVSHDHDVCHYCDRVISI
ncbi:ATP-binding cassette domain-containing protein [Pseudogracilibacillus sp. SO30301A]|uniref:ATP-binding cassette domain-containing protein n=1 Tax=Pseudogracilibacillus sp. SO30301A TaxID=3098291 RepID=UPI00300E5D1B